MKKIRIVIIDDHILLSSGLEILLNKEADLEVVEKTDKPEEVSEMVQKLKPDIVLLDISLSGDINGLDLIPEILKVAPATSIIIMTMYEQQQYLKQAIDAGARGFILKKGADVDLLYAIRVVMKGDVYIQPSMVGGFIQSEETDSNQKISKDEKLWNILSQREQEVIQHVAKGCTSREIANQFFLSEKTIATYRSRAMIKLEMNTRSELVDFVIRLGKLE